MRVSNWDTETADCISIRNGYKMTDLYFAEVTKPLEEFECNKNMGDDNISRKAMLEAIDKLTKFVEIWRSDNSTEIVLSENDVCNAIKQLQSAQPEPQWIPCSERLPERIINGDVETVQEFFVTVKERWPGEEWKYHTDVAEFPGDYIDDVWQTYNDWKEGQEVHVIAWMPLPEPYQAERKDE